MKQVTLAVLHCETTEDDFGADETRIEIYADGELEHSFRAELNNGMDWPLNTSVLYADSIAVRLFDEDGSFPGDDDDNLGQVVIGGDAVDGAVAVFNQDGADYRLTYSVVDRSDLSAGDLVELALSAFESSTAPGVWAQIDKAALLADMRATLADPTHQINQNNSMFCGPTSLVYSLIRRQPRRYVRLSRELYETGSCTTRAARVTPSDGLRADSVGQGMSPADWMLIASMRENENLIFGASSDAGSVLGGLQGLTTHWEMQGWCSEILLLDNTANSTTFVWGELDAIRYAQRVIEGGGVAYLMIHADIIQTTDSVLPPWPTHWIVFQGGLSIDESAGTISFNYWTWGSDYSVNLSIARFESGMFGAVTAF